MFLPKTQEYALRCMARMALLPWEASITAENLSEISSVPRAYLSKVLKKLTAGGLLVAEKGHGGGFRLAVPPSSITFLQIMEATGFEFQVDRCVFGWGQCNAKSPCPLHESFSKLNRMFYEWASTTTLAQVNQSVTVAEQLKTFTARSRKANAR